MNRLNWVLLWFAIVALFVVGAVVTCGDDDDDDDDDNDNDSGDDDTADDDDDDSVSEEWSFVMVEQENGGQYHEVAIDGTGVVHFVYHSRDQFVAWDLKYATYDSGVWMKETIEPAEYDCVGGMRPSMAVGPNNDIHIVYDKRDCSDNSSSLKYVKISNGTVGTPDFIKEDGFAGEIRVDLNGSIHVSFYDTFNQSIGYASYTGESWEITAIVDTVQGYHAHSIALNNAGIPYIAYNVSDQIVAVRKDGAIWTQISALNDCEHCSPIIGLDQEDSMSVIFPIYDLSKSSDLGYARYDGNEWQKETVTTGASNTYDGSSPYAIDVDGYGHTSFPICIEYGYDQICDSASLNYATNRGGSWTVYEVVPEATHTSDIFADSDGYAHIVYDEYNSSNKIIYATNKP